VKLAVKKALLNMAFGSSDQPVDYYTVKSGAGKLLVLDIQL